MNKVKKMLCIVLALAMMLIPMTVSAAPADGYRVAMHLTADNTTVAPGDMVTFSLTVDVDDWGSLWGLPCFYLMYNDAIFAPDANFKTDKTALRMPMGDFGEYVIAENGINNTITSSNYTAVKNKFATSGESATDYTGGVMMTFSVNNDGGYTTAGGINYTDADTVQIEFYLYVDANAADGTYRVGLPYAAYLANKAYFNCCDTGRAVRVASSAIDVSDAYVDITVSSAEPSIVNPHRDGQIRFHKNGTAYAGSFDVRALAVISGADFDATFGDIATAKTMISEIGFVFAQGANVTAPSMDAVKALVENGTAAAGYAKKTVNYISTSVDEGNYVFSCIATDIPDAEKNNSLVAVGYIAYTVDGETVYAYYPTAQPISFETLYNTHYNTPFPQA